MVWICIAVLGVCVFALFLAQLGACRESLLLRKRVAELEALERQRRAIASLFQAMKADVSARSASRN